MILRKNVTFLGQWMLLMLLLLPGARAAEPQHQLLFETAVEEIMDSDDIVGLAMAVVRGGEITRINTYGLREFGRPEKIDPETTFRIASLSKAFAATLTGDLVRQNKLSLDSPIVRYNPNFKLARSSQAQAATIQDVLSHRLSLPPYAYDNLLEAGVPPNKILDEMKRVSPICPVGSCYAYQNIGFDMITSAIEEVTAGSFEHAVSARLFKPLKMTGASFGVDGLKQHPNWARSHQRINRGAWRVREVKQPYYDVPAAGGVNANILDMAKWLQAQMGHMPDVIDRATLQLLHSPVVATPAELRRNRRMTHLTQAHYGLGWRIYEYGGQTVVNHSGSVEGYSARIAFLPERDVGIVLLSNSRSRQFWDILPLFLDAELGLANERLDMPPVNLSSE